MTAVIAWGILAGVLQAITASFNNGFWGWLFG